MPTISLNVTDDQLAVLMDHAQADGYPSPEDFLLDLVHWISETPVITDSMREFYLKAAEEAEKEEALPMDDKFWTVLREECADYLKQQENGESRDT